MRIRRIRSYQTRQDLPCLPHLPCNAPATWPASPQGSQSDEFHAMLSTTISELSGDCAGRDVSSRNLRSRLQASCTQLMYTNVWIFDIVWIIMWTYVNMYELKRCVCSLDGQGRCKRKLEATKPLWFGIPWALCFCHVFEGPIQIHSACFSSPRRSLISFLWNDMTGIWQEHWTNQFPAKLLFRDSESVLAA